MPYEWKTFDLRPQTYSLYVYFVAESKWDVEDSDVHDSDTTSGTRGCVGGKKLGGWQDQADMSGSEIPGEQVCESLCILKNLSRGMQ